MNRSPRTAPAPAEAFRHHRDALPNGLRVVTVETPHLHSALMAVYVRSGSRHEAARVMGVSHFLEHMFFRGSHRHRDTVAMNALVEAAGGNLNGVTLRDHGYYYTPLHPDALEVGFDVLGDMLQRPRMVEVPTERRIILEEMNDELDERGRDVDLDNLSKMALFAGHGLAHKIAGTRRTVRAIELADLRAHHRRMYCARNMVLACVGPVRRAKVRALAEKHFGGLRAGHAVRDDAPPAAAPGPVLHLTAHEDSPQSELRLNFRAPPYRHPDHPALVIARRVLDDGLSSWLPFEVVEKRGLAYDVRAEMDAFSDVAVFELEAATTHSNAPRVVALMGEVLARLITVGPSREELERAKNRHRIGLEFAMDSSSDLSHWFGANELWGTAESYARRLERIQGVTLEHVRAAAARVFTRANLHAVLVGRGGRTVQRRMERALASLPIG